MTSVLSGLGIVLEAPEFEVTTASNVDEALKHITSKSFDVLLSDLHMPGEGDGLTVVSAMRHANPKAVTLLLSANPDMTRATTAILRQADDDPAEAGERGGHYPGDPPAAGPGGAVAGLPDRGGGGDGAGTRERFDHPGVASEDEGDRQTQAAPITVEEQREYLPDALHEIVYRLRYPQTLGSMTLFSMASLQHGARRRRQGFPAPVLVEEARALQVGALPGDPEQS